MSSAPLIVDVRTSEEFSEGAFPGAINIPLHTVPARLAEFGALETPIIVYCAAGVRSGQAQHFLRNAGYTNVENGGGLSHMMQRLA